MSQPSRLLMAAVAAGLVLSACSGSDTVIADTAISDTAFSDTASGETAGAATDNSPAAESEAPAPEAATANPTATVTLSTGETFALEARSCETQATDPNSLLNDRFFDLSGRTVDGEYRFSLNSAQAAESSGDERVIGGLTAERDENDVNPDIDYVVQGPLDGNPDVMIVVDGARVSGQVVLDAKFSRNKAFGDTVTATFEFNCG